MFWGLTLKPGKRHTEVLSEEICLSMATLESRKDFGEKPDNYSHVVINSKKSDFLLCTLVHGLHFQQNLNVKLMPKEKITFHVQGTSVVYLTGFTPSCPVGDDVLEDEVEKVVEEVAGVVESVDEEEGNDAGWREDEFEMGNVGQEVEDEEEEEEDEEQEEDVIEALCDDGFTGIEERTEGSIPLEQSLPSNHQGKDDVFLSITELDSLSIKEEVMDQDDQVEERKKIKKQESYSAGKSLVVPTELTKTNSKPLSRGGTFFGNSLNQSSSSEEQGESEEEWIASAQNSLAVEPKSRMSDMSESMKLATEEDIEEEINIRVGSGERDWFKCEHCSLTFPSQSKKLQHQITHNRMVSSSQRQLTEFPLQEKKHQYTCQYCSKTLSSNSSMRRHERTHSKRHKKFRCRFCQRGFLTSVNRERHESLHNTTNVYKCLICDRGFEEIQSRDKHVLSHFKKDSQRCEMCLQVSCHGECMHTEEVLSTPKLTSAHEARYKCGFCRKVFRLRSSRDRHQKIHGEIDGLPTSSLIDPGKALPNANEEEESMLSECMYCYRTFATRELCKQHERAHMGEIRPFTCRCCSKTFMKHHNRRKHELRHPEISKYVCQYCHKRFSKLNLCQIHEAKHKAERPFNCRYCERLFVNKGSLKKHEIVHIKDNSIKSPKVEESMTSLPNTIAENTSLDNISPATRKRMLCCRVCQKIFSSTGNRSRHEKLHKGLILPKMKGIRHICNVCKKSYRSFPELQKHVCVTPALRHKCKHCNKLFADKGTLATHELAHNMRASPLKGNTKCQHCGKIFGSRGACVVHERIHTGEKPFSCGLCDFRTSDPSTYSKHKKRHLKKSYNCISCPAGFLTETQLEAHQVSHIDSYACNECNKTFPSLTLLTNHQGTHSSFRPYKCSHCPDTFSTVETLRHHESSHELDQPFKCRHCGRHFKTNIGLQKHSLLCAGGKSKSHKCRYCCKSFSSVNGCHLHEQSHIVAKPFQCSQCNKGFLSNHNLAMHEKMHTL